MGKPAIDTSIRALNAHTETLHEVFKMLDEEVPASLEKVDWNEVNRLGDQISKQATVAGMLCSGEAPKEEELEGNMKTYCNMLQGFLLLCHGSTVGAGPTLRACICASAKQVMDSSLLLLRATVLSNESRSLGPKLSIPQLVGAVWEACNTLKKTPTTNCTAIGRAITQIALSMKDVIREMKELKPRPTTSSADEAGGTYNADKDGDDGSCTSDLGSDLSLEMAIAELVTSMMSDALVVIRELIRFVTNLLKQLDHISSDHVDCLERLLEICQQIGVQVDDLGACVYPPQEVSAMMVAVKEISSGAHRICAEVLTIGGSSVEGVLQACHGLEVSLRKLEPSLGCVDQDLVHNMQGLVVST